MRFQAHKPAFVLKLPMRRLCALYHLRLCLVPSSPGAPPPRQRLPASPRREEGGGRKEERREQGGGTVRREEGGRRRNKGRSLCKASWGYAPGMVRQCFLSLFIITPMRRDYAPREVSRRTPPAHSLCEFYKYGYAPDPMRRETLSGATPGA